MVEFKIRKYVNTTINLLFALFGIWINKIHELIHNSVLYENDKSKLCYVYVGT